MRQAIVLALFCLAATGCARTLPGGAADIGQARTRFDAKFVVYTRYLTGDRLEVWIARINGSGKRRLAAGRSPRISPDGRWVVYNGGCDPSGDCPRLYLIASAGGRRRALAPDGSDVRWSPDSRRVVFANGRGLVRFEVATGRSDEIVRGNVQWGWSWSFSPAGDEIAYSVARRGHCFGSNFDIYVVRVSGGTPRRLTTNGCSAFPVWGTGGIAFARLISYRGWGRHEIWRMTADGTERRTITGRLPERLLGQGVTGLVPIAWSDDGRRLLAGLANEFGSVPFAVDPKRGTMRKIGNYGYADWPDGLSRDGRSVLVSVGNVASYDGTRVEIVAYTGGRGRVIARRAGEASWNL
jgi:dipeptidyl aminopeptidase/acylaminoacyl peptidase